jgi:hypothetical protein
MRGAGTHRDRADAHVTEVNVRGAAVDKLNADPAFQTWQAKRLKAGLTTLVRANMATEIEI